jgi:hypothetical protein
MIQGIRIIPASYTEDLYGTAALILDSGYNTKNQPKESFKNQPTFDLKDWKRGNFAVPPSLEKNQIFEKNQQEVKLKFIYHEDNGVGFSSIAVVSLLLRRGLPVEIKGVPDPSLPVRGAKWSLFELRYLKDSVRKELLCLSW